MGCDRTLLGLTSMDWVWSFGNKCCSNCDGGQRLCTMYEDTHTYAAGPVANFATPTEWSPGWSWWRITDGADLYWNFHWHWAHDTDDWNTYIWEIPTKRLLDFTRAQRGGSWELHLYAFRCMLPYFFSYDHVNYARWGAIYLAKMALFPRGILHEFQQGNFVLKHANQRFNQLLWYDQILTCMSFKKNVFPICRKSHAVTRR